MALTRIARARTRIERGSRVREVVFGLQDALLATVGLVAGVDGATRQNSRVVIFAGLSHLVAGAISMGAGEYLSSAAQRRVTSAAARDAQRIGADEPYVVQEGVLTALEAEGLDRAAAYRVVDLLSSSPGALTTMFQATALGISGEDTEQPRRQALGGAIVMGLSFALGAILPVIPYFALSGHAALLLSIGIAAAAIFAVGAAIGRLSEDNPLRAAVEFSIIAVGAGGIGYAAGLVISAIAGQTVSAGVG